MDGFDAWNVFVYIFEDFKNMRLDLKLCLLTLQLVCSVFGLVCWMSGLAFWVSGLVLGCLDLFYISSFCLRGLPFGGIHFQDPYLFEEFFLSAGSPLLGNPFSES